MLTLKAPAKINLTLEVLRKRPDGFHEIRSVLQTLDLCDTLVLETSKSLSFGCDISEWSIEKSLLKMTVDLLKKVTGCEKGADIKLNKRIPLLSGLGGDSSAAAALLRGLNELWRLALAPEKLRGLAAQLGSDVVFFLQGGTALAEGRGEIVLPLPAPPEMWLVLVAPDIPVGPGKTGRMYTALMPGYFTGGEMTEKLIKTLHKTNQLDSSLLFNTFENIAFGIYPGLGVYKEHLIKLGAPRVHLAGSGPTLFTIFHDKEKADDLYARCKNQGLKTFLAKTL